MSRCRFPHRVLAVASLILAGCSTKQTPPPGATITRLDGSTIDTATLTRRIEELTRAAKVHGLTVTIFNDADEVYSRGFGFADAPTVKPLRTDTPLEWENYVPYDRASSAASSR